MIHMEEESSVVEEVMEKFVTEKGKLKKLDKKDRNKKRNTPWSRWRAKKGEAICWLGVQL